ncbi:hypothetical protein [Alienimonas chondri]|uniref:Membrane-associated protein n=1 Tax=Alienimonas chondri TaxID=2681879 RepID=A0ABX1VBN0_9PLAN|nr:hypothetical protein [Alienimonas chondri]
MTADTPSPADQSAPPRRVPWPAAAIYTAFLAVLVPVYWHYYGPTNFLYFCDLALFLALISVWTQRSLWASAAAVGILIPQAVWVADFFVTMAGGELLGMTDYMFDFDNREELFLRGLSFFHFWLPFLLGYIVWKLGYDRRGLVVWTVIAWAAMLIGYFLLPGPGEAPDRFTPQNVNYVFGTSEKEPQTMVPPLVWFGGLLIGLPALVFVPTHFALRALCVDATPGAAPRRVPLAADDEPASDVSGRERSA